jgi:hypothetical protein
MRQQLTTIALVMIVTVGAGRAVAQPRAADAADVLPSRGFAVELLDAAPDIPPAVLINLDELAEWVHEFTKWKEWSAQWGNRREPGWFTQSRQRRPRPDPPAWLVDSCDPWTTGTNEMSKACELVAEWRRDGATSNAATVAAAAVAADEADDKMTWWEHVHLDGAWPAMQTKGVYGVVGMHATTNVRGRFQIFVAPGAMLLNVPTRDGHRAWKVATNYGITYRLGEISVPGGRQAVLHMNLAKAWLIGETADVSTKSTDFVGFSLTFKKP